MIGNGELLTQSARLVVVTPADVPLTTTFQVFNTTNFPTLQISEILDGILSFDQLTGIFTILNTGYLTLNATMNFTAEQASADLLLIPEFNFSGGGWVRGVPRKEALTAIRASQITWAAGIHINKGDQIRFNFAEQSGDISMCTQILDQGGPLEVVLPFAIFYVAVHREYGYLPRPL